MHWGRKRPGDPGHAPRIGAGNGALGQVNCLPQCLFSCPNAAHRTRGRTAAVVSSHGVRPRTRRRRPDQANGDHQRCRQTASNTRPVGAPFSQRYRDPRGRLRGLSRTAALFSQQYHTFAEIPRFASVITLAKCGIPLKTPLHLQTTPAPAQRQRNVGIPGESSCNPPQRARLPFENTASLAKHPEPPALDHSALRDKGTSSASTSPARSWANVGPHWGRKQRVGAGNRSLGQANNLPQCGLTYPNATRGAREGAVRAQ